MAEAVLHIPEINGVDGSPTSSQRRGSRRYSIDDIGCHYSSLTHMQLLTPLDGPQGWGVAGASLPRRQSVASVQTEERYRSPRPAHRRRSELNAHDKRRKSRGEVDALMDPAAMNGVRRGTRCSQVLSPFDLESARLSVSSNRTRKSSRRSSQPEEIDPEERRRNRVVLVCASVAVAIFLIAILLVAVTLKMSPAIDEIGELTSSSCLPACLFL